MPKATVEIRVSTSLKRLTKRKISIFDRKGASTRTTLAHRSAKVKTMHPADGADEFSFRTAPPAFCPFRFQKGNLSPPRVPSVVFVYANEKGPIGSGFQKRLRIGPVTTEVPNKKAGRSPDSFLFLNKTNLKSKLRTRFRTRSRLSHSGSQT